jgi:hypothetical protein
MSTKTLAILHFRTPEQLARAVPSPRSARLLDVVSALGHALRRFFDAGPVLPTTVSTHHRS